MVTLLLIKYIDMNKFEAKQSMITNLITHNPGVLGNRIITLEVRLEGNGDDITIRLYQELSNAVDRYSKAAANGPLYLSHVTDVGDVIDEMNTYLDDPDAYNKKAEFKGLSDERIGEKLMVHIREMRVRGERV